MSTKLDYNPPTTQLREDLPEIWPGDRIKIYQKIKEGEKERIQTFEGLVIAKKHGKGISSTITVRKVLQGIGVEKTYPLHSPTIEKIEILKHSKVRRAKLYYIRKRAEKKVRKKLKEVTAKTATREQVTQEEPKEKPEIKKD